MMQAPAMTGAERAKMLGVARATLYYKSTLQAKDETLRRRIEEVLREHRSYGHKRIATHLGINKKRIRRVMQKFGIKPYRRRGTKYRRVKPQNEKYPNLLQLVTPAYEGCVWAADFTHLSFQGTDVIVATTIDLFSRKVVGASVATSHPARIVMQAFANGILTNGRPAIFHSDNGSEYHAKAFRTLLTNLGVAISRSKKGCPWENGYQESFYNQFKIDLGDPNRFSSLGELTAAIYETLHAYNTTRIHSALRMSPNQFALAHAAATISPAR
jgi:putative transposase